MLAKTVIGITVNMTSVPNKYKFVQIYFNAAGLVLCTDVLAVLPNTLICETQFCKHSFHIFTLAVVQNICKMFVLYNTINERHVRKTTKRLQPALVSTLHRGKHRCGA